jgi:hypothetical protein
MSDTPTLPVRPHDKSATKVRCAYCRQQFEPKDTGRPPKFCGDACRIAAWRKPGKDRRLQQRNIRFERLNRDRAFSIRGYSGPAVSGVPDSDSISLTAATR